MIAGKTDSKESVPSAAANLSISDQQTNKPALNRVLINFVESGAEIRSLGAEPVFVSNAELLRKFPQTNSSESFAPTLVGINTIAAQTTAYGVEGLLPKESCFIAARNGKPLVRLFGNETMLNADVAESDLTILNKPLSAITFDHFDLQKAERTLATLCWFVVRATSGFIPEKTRIKNFWTIECAWQQGYTAFGRYGDEIKEVSDTQRYKGLGNSFTVNVIEAIITRMLEKGCIE